MNKKKDIFLKELSEILEDSNDFAKAKKRLPILLILKNMIKNEERK
jgi:hypothetical protein